MTQLEYLEAHLELTISPMDFYKSAEKDLNHYLLLDVRNGPAHIKKSKINGAVEMPEAQIGKQDLSQTLSNDKTIVVYCWDTWCNLGKKAAYKLIQHGYQVKELSGGINAWRTLRLPEESLLVGKEK